MRGRKRKEEERKEEGRRKEEEKEGGRKGRRREEEGGREGGEGFLTLTPTPEPSAPTWTLLLTLAAPESPGLSLPCPGCSPSDRGAHAATSRNQ